MTRKLMFPTLSVAAACALGAGPIASAGAATEVQQASSGNWAGYVVGAGSGTTKTFKSVTGSWVQPTAKCSSSGATYSAFWVGLGGADGHEALEQDGTEANCDASGTAHYYAWYELVPKAPVKVDLAVSPGDSMTATTTVNGDQVTESIVNHTTGQSYSKTLTMSNPDVSTAEWVAEAPSQCQSGATDCTALPLSNFGKVSFTSATATDSSGQTGTISSNDWSTAALTLDPSESSSGMSGYGYGYTGDVVSSGSTGSASPSSLTNGGSAFNVTYKRSSGDSSSQGSSYGYPGSAGEGYGYGGGYGYSSGYPGSSYGYPGSSYGYSGGYGDSSGYGYSGGYGDGGYIVIYGY